MCLVLPCCLLFFCLAKLIPASCFTCLLTFWFDLNFHVVNLYLVCVADLSALSMSSFKA